MARVTIEDCVEHIPNRFLLVQAAIRRTRQLMEGSRPLVKAKNREAVIALREIAAQKVKVKFPSKDEDLLAPTDETGEDEELLLDAEIEEVSVDQMDRGDEEGSSGEEQQPDLQTTGTGEE